jgi:hypothetical protein
MVLVKQSKSKNRPCNDRTQPLFSRSFPAGHVNSNDAHGPSELPRLQRSLCLIIGGTLLTLLITAACLEPSPLGLGTHQQLGLPPCTLLERTGYRCPSCGMTTSWANLTRGRIMPALRASTSGTLLGVGSMFGVVWLLISGAWGRWFIVYPNPWIILITITSVIVVILCEWGWRLLTA